MCLSFKQGHPSQASGMCFDRYGDVTPGERGADGDSTCWGSDFLLMFYVKPVSKVKSFVN